MWGKRVIAVALAAVLVLGWQGEGLIAQALGAEMFSLSGKTKSGGSARQNAKDTARHQSEQRATGHYVDFSSGGGLSNHAKSSYGTATIAVGRPLEQDGWRVRLSGGYGMSSYSDHATTPCDLAAQELFQKTSIQFSSYCRKLSENKLSADDRAKAEQKLASLGYELTSENEIHKKRAVRVETLEVSFMPGYQMAFGPLIVKAFAGVAYNSGEAKSSAPGWLAELRFDELWGARMALETWLTLSDRLWFSLDASYGVALQRDQKNDLAFHDYATTARLGYRVLPWLTLGPEASAFGKRLDVDASYDSLGDADLSEATDTTRTGGFMRLRFQGTETTISGGLSIDSQGNDMAYGSASVYMKF